jgi:glycosyltransferase involved in cell wall biosynthesis
MSTVNHQSPPRIMLVILSLSAGGAERVISEMASWWASHDREVALLTPWGSEHDHYRLDPGVRRIGLGLRDPSRTAWQRIADRLLLVFRIRRAVLEFGPDAVISFIDLMNIVMVAALAGTGIPLVVSERIDPRHHPISALRSLARRIAYPFASALVVQTASVAGWAASVMPASRIEVIPNFVRVLPGQAASRPPEGHFILAMGRLNRQKGHDLLIRAFAAALKTHGEWSLVILGDGPLRNELADLAARLGISRAVALPGVVDEPVEWLRSSGIFVHPSRYEGFPNALLEAMSCGCAVIATDCPSGPAEIVRNGENGVLVPSEDVDALLSALCTLMDDENLRRKLGEQAVLVNATFSQESVMSKWDALVGKVAGRS